MIVDLIYFCILEMKILGIEEFTDSNKIWKMLCAEFIGTFFLVLIGCGTIMYVQKSVLVVQVALTFGLVIAAMAQVIFQVIYIFIRFV